MKAFALACVGATQTAFAQWTGADALPFPVMGNQGGVYDGRLFSVGGYTGTAITHAILEYARTWNEVGSAPTTEGVGSDDSGSAVLGRFLYLVGGIWSSPTGIKNVSTMVTYDIEAKTWSIRAPMITPRRGFPVGADSMNGRLYAVGGIDCKQNCYGEDVKYLSVAEEYTVSTDSWRALPTMRVARRDAAAGFFNGQLYVVGGCNNHGGSSSTACYALPSVEVYDPKHNAWKLGPALLTARHGHGVGICPGLGLLAFGGSAQAGIMNNPTPEPTSELLTFSTGKRVRGVAAIGWQFVGNLSTPRYGLMKGFGLNVAGDVYAVGGSTLKPGTLTPSTVVEKFSCSSAAALVEAL